MHPDWGYYIHGILDDVTSLGTNYRGIEVVGVTNDLPALLGTNEDDEIVLTLNHHEYEKLKNVVGTTEKFGVQTKEVPE